MGMHAMYWELYIIGIHFEVYPIILIPTEYITLPNNAQNS